MDTEELKDKTEPEETKPETKAEEAPEQKEAPSAKPQEISDTELTTLKAELARARTERTAALKAIEMGVDTKHIPYVLKLAEYPDNADDNAISEAIKKVIDDIPAFKAASGRQKGIRIGADDPKETSDSDMLSRAFGNKKN